MVKLPVAGIRRMSPLLWPQSSCLMILRSYYPLLLAVLLLPGRLLAQRPPQTFNSPGHTEPDQELDGFSGKFKSIHLISASVRGVRAAGQIVYWVSADRRRLSAFRAGSLLWCTDVVAPFQAEIPAVRIHSLVLSSELLFVSLGRRGLAEIDRKSGHVAGRYFDRDPNNLRAE
ncbi:hypothetical protein A0257_06855 [Hymenobacter psoromatis]|nr:hypothetical protein A0257_06855 [Hymenobacter psoromatis]